MGQTATKTKQRVERTATKTKQIWSHLLKESFTCFAPFSRWKRGPAEETQAKDEDDIQEERPLLRHRLASGFTARTDQSMQKASALRSRAGKKFGKVVAGIPTPLRPKNSSQRNSSVTSSCITIQEDVDTFGLGEFDLEDIWDIGSEDDEEQPFSAGYAISSSLGATTSNPIVTCSVGGVPSIGVPSIGGIKKINLQPSGTPIGSTNVFYVGTPRDCP